MPSHDCFVSPGTGLVHTMPTSYRAAQPRATHQSQQGHSNRWYIRETGMAYIANTIQYRQSALITAQVLRVPRVMACHSLKRTQVNPLCLSKNLISYHAQQPVQTWIWVLSPSTQQEQWPMNSGLAHWAN